MCSVPVEKRYMAGRSVFLLHLPKGMIDLQKRTFGVSYAWIMRKLEHQVEHRATLTKLFR